MNAMSPIRQRTTAEAMIEEGIYQIRCYRAGAFSVQLHDGSLGVGETVSEALDKAKAGNVNVLRVA